MHSVWYCVLILIFFRFTFPFFSEQQCWPHRPIFQCTCISAISPCYSFYDPCTSSYEGRRICYSTCRSISDTSFSIQSAASRPTVTHARTPHKVTSSGWKPLTQPVALTEERKCATLTTAKRSRLVASSRAVKDSTNHSASKANLPVPSGAYLILIYLFLLVIFWTQIFKTFMLFQAKSTEMKKTWARAISWMGQSCHLPRRSCKHAKTL